jgi:hypothetical protein
MKKILLAMTALTALAAAAPAAAQYSNRAQIGTGIEARIGELDTRLDAGIRHGSISRDEARSLRTEMRMLVRLERQYGRDGLSRGERDELRQRLQGLREHIRMAERSGGGYGRDDRWSDRDDRDGRDCPPGLDRRDNGCVPPGQEGRDGRWEDRRDDRDERWEDRRDDRDERWDDRRDGGLIGDVLGGGLRVGQRVTARLDPVPYEYRSQYRDGNGVYYGSDGRRIYRIDARTNVVLQVYAMRR